MVWGWQCLSSGEGRLDSKSVSTALPVIQSDVEDYLMAVGLKTVKLYEQAEKSAKPYVERYTLKPDI